MNSEKLIIKSYGILIIIQDKKSVIKFDKYIFFGYNIGVLLGLIRKMVLEQHQNISNEVLDSSNLELEKDISDYIDSKVKPEEENLWSDALESLTESQLADFLSAEYFSWWSPKAYTEIMNIANETYLWFSLRAALQMLAKNDTTKYDESWNKLEDWNWKTALELLWSESWGGLTNSVNEGVVRILQNLTGAYVDGKAGPQTIYKIIEKLDWVKLSLAEWVNDLYKWNEKFQVMNIGSYTSNGVTYKFNEDDIKIWDGTGDTFKLEFDNQWNLITEWLKIDNGWIVLETEGSIKVPDWWVDLNKKGQFNNKLFSIKDVKYFVDKDSFPRDSVLIYDDRDFYSNGRVIWNTEEWKWSWKIENNWKIQIIWDSDKTNVVEIGQKPLPENATENVVSDINSIPNNIWEDEKFVIKNNMWDTEYEFYSSRFVSKVWWTTKEWTRKRIEWNNNKTLLMYEDGIIDFTWRKELFNKGTTKYTIDDVNLIKNILSSVWAWDKSNLYFFDTDWNFKKWIQRLKNWNSMWFYQKNWELIKVFKDKWLSYRKYDIWDKETAFWKDMWEYTTQANTFVINKEYENLV